MTEERRYSEDEIAEILERATSPRQGLLPGEGDTGVGLTLSELQAVASEVGIPPERIAQAAGTLAPRTPSGPAPTYLGAPRGVSHLVPIPREMTEGEWTRLVVELRETFRAQGKVGVQGSLRTWSNGNLQVHVEPGPDGFRVRMQTFRGDFSGRMAMAWAGTLLGALLVILTLLGEVSSGTTGIVMAAVFGGAGLGQFGYTRVLLDRWARERMAQMEWLGERIPLLMGEDE